MHPIHDVDALLLLAMALSSKRRPAELFELMAAIDLIQQGAIPSEAKLCEAFHRLSEYGLISEEAGRFTLTAAGQKSMAGQRAKDDTAARIFRIKEKLAAYHPQGEHTAIALTTEQMESAIQAHRASGAGAGQNLLVPKPKPVEDNRRPAPWRRPGPPRGSARGPARGRKA